MENFYLFIILCISFCGGYFLMKHVDSYLQKDDYQQNEADNQEPPVCVIFEIDLSEEEIIKEIKHFKENHKTGRVCLYSDSKENEHG